jgi:hypothetical protein
LQAFQSSREDSTGSGGRERQKLNVFRVQTDVDSKRVAKRKSTRQKSYVRKYPSSRSLKKENREKYAQKRWPRKGGRHG